MKHKSIDHKLIAVKYYFKNDISMDKLCDIFECKKVHLEIGLINIKILTIFLEIIEIQYLIK